MNKDQFLIALITKLNGLPQEDIERSVGYYSEMIDDRIEEGVSEEEAVAVLGSIEDIATQILGETSLVSLLKKKFKKRRLRTWEIVLLVVGSPIWLSLLVSVLACVVSVYVSLWCVVVSLYAANVSFAACAVGGVILSVVYIMAGNVGGGIFLLGSAFVLAGLAIFLFFGCRYTTKGMIFLTKKIFAMSKRVFVRKEKKDEENF